MLLLSTASIVILFGMAGLYSFMCRFYHDYFYAFVALGWIANAFYMGLEGFKGSSATSQVGIWTYLYATLSFVPFFLAGFCNQRQCDYLRGLTQIFCWFAGIAIAVWGCLIGFHVKVDVVNKGLLIATVVSIPYQVWTLLAVGLACMTRFGSDHHRAWGRILAITFFVYAGLQLFSHVRLSPEQRTLTITIFSIALITKAVNSVSAATLLAMDFNSRMKRRSALEEIGALTASIEHDIRNPLNISNGIIESMRERFQAQEGIVTQLKRIEEQNRRIYAATEVVRTLRGLDEFYDRLIEKTNINDALSRSIKAIKDGMPTEDIQFIKIDSKILYVRSCRSLLQQALVNVLKNAVEAIREANRKSGHVTVSWAKAEGMVLVAVSDDGVGILAENMPKLGHFFSTKTEGKSNSGIGLFISLRIMEFHKGRMQVESTAGKGTTVTLSIPEWTGNS